MQPDDIAGLILWLQADAITGLSDGDRINLWEDSSAEGNDFIDSTIANVLGPVYETNELNGLPIARFTEGSGNQAGMQGDPALVLAHPYTIFYVGKYNDTDSQFRRIVSSLSTNWLMGPYSGTWQWFSGGFATAGPSATDGAWVIHAVRAQTSSGTHFVWPLASEDAPFSAARANPAAIGTVALGYGGSSEPAESDVAEVIVYDSELSDTDRDAVVAYLRAKWAGIVHFTNLLVVELDDADSPASDADHFLRIRARTDAGTGTIRVRLFQDATLIGGFEFDPTGTFDVYDYELDEAEAALITDYGDLQLHVDVLATSSPFTPEVDWVELQRPPEATQALTGTLFQSTPTFAQGAVTTGAVTLSGVLFQSAPLFDQGVVGQTGGPQVLSGILFQKAPTFPTGAISVGAVALTGVLYQNAPTFFSGSVTASAAISGVLYQNAPTFPSGAVSVGAVTLDGSLFQKAPSFFGGSVTATRALTGTLFTNAPTFFSGSIAATRTLTGTLFENAPTFLTGTVTPGAVALIGTLFENVPTFFVGTMSVGGVTLSGMLFQNAPLFEQGVLNQQGGPTVLSGVLFTRAPTFPSGAISTGPVTVTGALFQKAPTFPQGSLTASYTLSGVLFQNAPTFFVGVMIPTQIIDGTLFQNAPVFPQGALSTGALEGVLFQKAPTFFIGVLTQFDRVFPTWPVSTLEGWPVSTQVEWQGV